MIRRAGAVVAAGLCVAGPVGARTLTVGDGKDFKLPSEAVAAAQDGDTVLIAPGQYFDCAIVRQNNLTVAGDGEGAAMTDKACEGKALLVIRGDHATVRNLTLARARVPDDNGAGIRAEAPNLTVQRVSFENDQVGVLAGSGGGQISIDDCRFSDGGTGGDTPKYAVMAGQSALLRIAQSSFKNVKGGQIASMATRTEVIGNTIETGAAEAAAEAVFASQGALLLLDNVITVGPNRPRHDAAVALWDGATGVLRHNRLVNQTGQPVALLQDWSWEDPVLEDNEIGRGDEAVTSAGIWRHRASVQLHARKDEARALAGQLKRLVQQRLR